MANPPTLNITTKNKNMKFRDNTAKQCVDIYLNWSNSNFSVTSDRKNNANINPSVMAYSIAAQVGGYLTLLNSYYHSSLKEHRPGFDGVFIMSVTTEVFQ